MKYKMNVSNDSDNEELEIEGTSFTELVHKIIEFRNSKSQHNIYYGYDFYKDIIQRFVLVWNNKFDKFRDDVKNILTHYDSSLISEYWNIPFDNKPFTEDPPTSHTLEIVPSEPIKEEYIKWAERKITLFDIITLSRNAIIEDYLNNYEKDYQNWLKNKRNIEESNQHKQNAYNILFSQYTNNKLQHEKKQKRELEKYKNRKKELNTINIDEVVEYINVLIKKISFPIDFTTSTEVEYVGDTKNFIINYLLPNIEDMYLVKEIKSNISQNKIIEKPLPQKDIDELYNYLIYSICLQVIRYVFNSEAGVIIDSIVFNGWIEGVDKSTGQDFKACIISLHTTKDAFTKINLARVNPIDCFKSLKGVSGAKLTNLTPVAPIIDINTKDKRFVASQDVLKDVDKGTNLASMGWEEFEHLIRELFEKEFSQNGGEVKITQASRDGGVDAIAFDPDPIRGGKIVIQAKRYTNVVGVSAVRDLFGTLMNEGATKGILVTTSNYGSDAYDFAKGKPITLLSGANLLNLLGKHGVNARIDLKEAKKILDESEKNKK
jgi:restriction system protein